MVKDVMKEHKDIGIKDRGMVWNTDLVEALQLFQQKQERNQEELMQEKISLIEMIRLG